MKTKRPLRQRVRRAASAAWREIAGTTRQRSEFAGAASNRLLLDWIARPKLADEEIRGDIKQLRSRARELSRNNSYAKRYFRLLANNVIGPGGITLQARLRNGTDFDAATNDMIEAAWKSWSSRPVTLDGKMTLRRFERLLIKTLACDGEALVRLWRSPAARFGLALQAIDADVLDETFDRPRQRDGENEIRMGVELDPLGRPVAYHLRQDLDSWRTNIARVRERVPADQIIHLYDPDRVNQTRGVTWLHSIMVPAHMLNAYEDSEAIGARIAASMGGFFIPNEDYGGEVSNEPAEMEANPGTFQIGPANTTFAQFDPKHPTAQFGDFVKQLLRKIASGMSVFYNVLANDAERVTYSTMRSFMLVERDDWKAIAGDFIEMWRQPLYTCWLQCAMLSGAIPADFVGFERYLEVEHLSRGWNWIDPEKEANGLKIAVEEGFDTLTRIIPERTGRSFEDILIERKRERELAKQYRDPLFDRDKTAVAARPAAKDEDEEQDDETDDEPDDNGNGRTARAAINRVATLQ